MSVKLLIVGADGMSSRIVSRGRDRLPFLHKLKSRSQYGTLMSVTGNQPIPLTGPAWSSIYTGCQPQEHGIMEGGWLIEHKNFSDLKKVTFWEIIQEYQSVGMLTMPMTFPPAQINGWIVSGFPAPPNLTKCVHPSYILKHLNGNFKIDLADGVTPGQWRVNFDASGAIKLERDKLRHFKSIFDAYPTEVVAFGTTLLDRFGHIYSQYSSKIMSLIYLEFLGKKRPRVRKIINRFSDFFLDQTLALNTDLFQAYIALDQILEELFNYCKPESMILCADHGFDRYGTFGNCVHDLFGFYCYYGPNAIAGKKEDSVLNISRMVLNALRISPEELGKDIKREKYSPDEAERAEIENQLRTLGYI
ncbi:MAG: alkaline phosphatase family protein [Thermodesulfobacteriota bacterium]|nr:alkaline phosphatase family protein [Thermodesulfobacteriota bacterium]